MRELDSRLGREPFAQVSAGSSSGGQDSVQHVAGRSQRSAGHEGADLKCSRRICARGLTSGRHARWRVGTYPGQQPRRRFLKERLHPGRRRTQRLNADVADAHLGRSSMPRFHSQLVPRVIPRAAAEYLRQPRHALDAQCTANP